VEAERLIGGHSVSVRVSIVLEDTEKFRTKLKDGVFPDEPTAAVWTERELESFRSSSLWEEPDECYLATLSMPDGTTCTAYLFSDWEPVEWDPPRAPYLPSPETSS
jgi:hypothetical protein